MIRVDFKWIDEIGLEYISVDQRNYLIVRLHIGDTKAQGRQFFARNPHGFVERNLIAGYRSTAAPYIRFSHFNSAVLWIGLTEEESRKTHNKRFFNQFAGKHQRDEWEDIENIFDELIADWRNKCYLPNWKERCIWEDKFENGNRAHFDVSFGTLLTVYLPYEQCQQLDDAETKTKIAVEIRSVIDDIKLIVEGEKIAGSSKIFRLVILDFLF